MDTADFKTIYLGTIETLELITTNQDTVTDKDKAKVLEKLTELTQLLNYY